MGIMVHSLFVGSAGLLSSSVVYPRKPECSPQRALVAGYVVDGEAIMDPYRFSAHEAASVQVEGLVVQGVDLRA